MDSQGPQAAAENIRFRDFEVDLQRAELWKSGKRIKLQPRPFQVLALLARRPGELVSREEIQHELWKGDTIVDFEQGLNFCIRRIRTARMTMLNHRNTYRRSRAAAVALSHRSYKLTRKTSLSPSCHWKVLVRTSAGVIRRS